MDVSAWVSVALMAVGVLFFIAGTVGLLRFPDVFMRIHALTKADNLGLGFIVAGLILQAESVGAVVQLLLIWLLVLVAASAAAHLIAQATLRAGIRPWERT